MSKVFVLDTNKQPLDPIHSGKARMLLSQGKAAVFRRNPFTLILKPEALNPEEIEPQGVKIDPGANGTELAIVNDSSGETAEVSTGERHEDKGDGEGREDGEDFDP